MRQLVYSVASSLDGFIAGPKGEYDWIVADPTYDFGALWNRFDTLVMGRKTYEIALTRFDDISKMGKTIVVASSTLGPAQHRGIQIVSGDIAKTLTTLKAGEGKDLWLMGGGVLCRTLMDAGLVDAVEVAVMPVLLGSGVPLLPPGVRHSLRMTRCRSRASGIVELAYSVETGHPSDPAKSVKSKRRKP